MKKKFQKIFDFLLFPIRALFISEESLWGLTSLRDERMGICSKYSSGRVLDIGCGRNNLFISKWVEDKSSVGVDVYGYEGVDQVLEDVTHLPFPDQSFDTVTLIAVGGHIPENLRVAEFSEISRVLKFGGRLLFTEGEPITQTICHIYRKYFYALLGKKDMDSERGMEHDEQYCMPKEEILRYLNTPPLVLIEKHKFMWGLNNLYIAKKC
jgi:SAM-dependent methyltransferase